MRIKRKEYVLPFSKTKSLCFKDYFYQNILLNESPYSLGKQFENTLYDNLEYNTQDTKENIMVNYTHIDTWMGYMLMHRKWEDDKSEDIYLVKYSDGEIYMTYAIFSFKDHGDFIESKFVWNTKRMRGLMFKFFTEYVMPHNTMIISDASQTWSGEDFWKKIINFSLKGDRYRPFVFSFMEKDKKYYNNLQKFEYVWLEDDSNLRVGVELKQ